MYQICRGIDLECVTPRFYSKSIGCCKRFPGRNGITGFNTLKHWIKELVTEIVERLEKDIEENNRQPKQSVISFTLEINGEDVAQSRSAPIVSIDQESLEQLMMEVLKKNIEPFFKKNEAAGLLNYPIKYMGISAGKFLTIEKKTVTLESMFAKQALKASVTPKEVDVSFAPGCSSTQVENNNLQENEKTVKENPLGKMFEKQSQMFKEKPREEVKLQEVKPKEKASFFQNFFTKSKNEDKKQDREVETQLPNSEEVEEETSEKTTQKTDEKEPSSLDTKALEDWFINDMEEEPNSDHPIYQNDTEKKALEMLYEIQSNIDGNESFDIEKEKNTLKRLMELKTTNDIGEPKIVTKKTDNFVKCETCGKNIIANVKAIQSHKDYHTALDVSREQREEFRQEVRNKILSPKQKPPPAKKAKLDTTVSSIKAFLEQREVSDESTVDQQPCNECGRLIDVDKLPEHADYHFARKIQIEMNSNDIKMVSKAKKPTQPKGKGKDSKSGPSVMSFFSQPSTSKTTIH